MTLEQLALLAVAVFALMALFVAFGTIRTFKRSSQDSSNSLHRIRRLIGSETSARMVAEGVIREITEKFPSQVEEARSSGAPPAELEEAIDKARIYFLSRVDSRHRGLFNLVVSEIVFVRNKVQ